MNSRPAQWLFTTAVSIIAAVTAGAVLVVMTQNNQQRGRGDVQLANVRDQIISSLSQLDDRLRKLEGRVAPFTDSPKTYDKTLNAPSPRPNELHRAVDEIFARLARLERIRSLDRSKASQVQAQDLRRETGQPIREQAEVLEKRLAREPIDSGLGNTVDSLTKQVLAKKPEWALNSEVSARCATTLCRIEIKFAPNLSQLDRFELETTLIQRIGSELPEGTLLQYTNQPNGRHALVGYFARPNHETE